MRLSPWMLIPYPVRVAMWVAVLALLWWAWRELDGALERHYTAEQSRMVAEDQARTSAASVRLLEAKNKALQKVLDARGKRLAAAERRQQEQDDEMERLKAEKPEVREWASTPVPDPVRARHGVR